MKNTIAALLMSSLLLTAPILAGSALSHSKGHSHGPHDQIDRATAEKNAVRIVSSLVKRGKVDKHWASTAANSIEKKAYNGKLEWKIAFINDKVVDAGKRTLYVFLNLKGQYILANYSGN